MAAEWEATLPSKRGCINLIAALYSEYSIWITSQNPLNLSPAETPLRPTLYNMKKSLFLTALVCLGRGLLIRKRRSFSSLDTHFLATQPIYIFSRSAERLGRDLGPDVRDPLTTAAGSRQIMGTRHPSCIRSTIYRHITDIHISHYLLIAFNCKLPLSVLHMLVSQYHTIV